MKNIKILSLLLMFPICAFGAERGESVGRIGVNRISQTATRASNGVASASMKSTKSMVGVAEKTSVESNSNTNTIVESGVTDTNGAVANCRDAYRKCMDEFCLLEESQGERCACSDNINAAKSKINEILSIQQEADNLFTEGVEREQLGAKARLVFTDNNANAVVSGADFMSWLTDNQDEEDEDVAEDIVMGSELYNMAKKYCQVELNKCE